METTGTAGGARPFTGEMEEALPFCCTGCTLPTATAGDCEEELVAIAGDDATFAADAYEDGTVDVAVLLEVIGA